MSYGSSIPDTHRIVGLYTGRNSEIAETIHNVRELTKIAEHEMHEAVLSCKRARRQMLRPFSASKPVLH